jgi:hypothetical protein
MFGWWTVLQPLRQKDMCPPLRSPRIVETSPPSSLNGRQIRVTMLLSPPPVVTTVLQLLLCSRCIRWADLVKPPPTIWVLMAEIGATDREEEEEECEMWKRDRNKGTEVGLAISRSHSPNTLRGGRRMRNVKKGQEQGYWGWTCNLKKS